jgi:hypothetical protein
MTTSTGSATRRVIAAASETAFKRAAVTGTAPNGVRRAETPAPWYPTVLRHDAEQRRSDR